MVEIGFAEIGAIATAVATIALVFVLWKTIKQLEASVKLSKVQTEFRFRPWIGPFHEIKKVEQSVNDKVQFDVSIKNFGELPAKSVVVKFKMDTKMLKRDVLQSNGVETFNLGPVLPNMEKHYWFFIENRNFFTIDLILPSFSRWYRIFFGNFFPNHKFHKSVNF